MVNVAKPDRLQRMIQALARVVGVGVETATVLVHEVFSRSFKDRRALGAFVGLTGTPYNSGGAKTEQGISKNGNARVRRMLSQLAWRWLGHQPESALAHCRLAASGHNDERSARTVEVRRKATSASFEPLQGGGAPLPAQASTPLQRFGPAALVPAPDERGHDG